MFPAAVFSRAKVETSRSGIDPELWSESLWLLSFRIFLLAHLVPPWLCSSGLGSHWDQASASQLASLILQSPGLRWHLHVAAKNDPVRSA